MEPLLLHGRISSTEETQTQNKREKHKSRYEAAIRSLEGLSSEYSLRERSSRIANSCIMLAEEFVFRNSRNDWVAYAENKHSVIFRVVRSSDCARKDYAFLPLR